jgi:hypothetical protein
MNVHRPHGFAMHKSYSPQRTAGSFNHRMGLEREQGTLWRGWFRQQG